MSGYRVRELSTEECDAIAQWRYAGRYATYDFDEGPPDPARGFFAVEDDTGRLVGYCCFGAEARVPGVEARAGAVDVGYGMQPELMGEGRGRQFLAAILAFALRHFQPERLRALVLDWNERSLAVCRGVGFEETGDVTTDSGRFLLLERSACRTGHAEPTAREA